jgi:hypothetical protein
VKTNQFDIGLNVGNNKYRIDVIHSFYFFNMMFYFVFIHFLFYFPSFVHMFLILDITINSFIYFV